MGTYRHTDIRPGHPFARALPDLVRQRLAEDHVLTRLDENGVAAVLKGRSGRQPPRELVALFYSETEGNPFFIEEMFRHLYETGKLFDDEGRFQAGIHVADTEVPRNIRLIISQRLQGLSEACRRMLTRVAVLGQNLEFSFIAALADLDEDALLDALDEAERASILRDASTGRDVRYVFVHEQIRQTLLAELSTPRRQRLHLRAADAMEELYGADAQDRATEISHYLYQAGSAADGVRTARYLMLAGDRGRSTSAFDEAIQMYDAAETVLPPGDTSTHAQIHLSRGMALRGAGRMEEALGAFRNAIDLLPRGDRQDLAVHERARLLLDLYRGNEAVQDLERLLTRATKTGDRGREFTSLLGLGRAYFIISLNESGTGERALDYHERAYALAKQIGNKAGMVRSLIPISEVSNYWMDLRPRAFASVEEAVRLAKEIGDRDLILDSEHARLWFPTAAEAREPAEELLRRLQTRRDPIRLKEQYFFFMWHYHQTAEFARCVEACDRGIDLAGELGAQPVLYHTIKALALINMGRFDEAWDALQQEVTGEPFGHAMQQFGMALYLMNLLAFEQAAEKAREVVALGIDFGRQWMRILGQAIRGTSLTQLGEARSGTLREIQEDLRSFGGVLGQIVDAEALLSEGSFDKALELAEIAIDDAVQTGHRLTHVQTLELKIRILLELGRTSEALVIANGACRLAEETDFASMLWRILGGRARARTMLGDTDHATADYRKAATTIREISRTIPDEKLRLGFESSHPVAPILAKDD